MATRSNEGPDHGHAGSPVVRAAARSLLVRGWLVCRPDLRRPGERWCDDASEFRRDRLANGALTTRANIVDGALAVVVRAVVGAAIESATPVAVAGSSQGEHAVVARTSATTGRARKCQARDLRTSCPPSGPWVRYRPGPIPRRIFSSWLSMCAGVGSSALRGKSAIRYHCTIAHRGV